MKTLRSASPSFYRWEHLVKNEYRLSNGPDIQGILSLMYQPSILFTPKSVDFYQAHADMAGHRYFCKCVFAEGAFRGCLLQEEEADQPLLFYDYRAPKHFWSKPSRIIVCDSGRLWRWKEGKDKGYWSLERGAEKYLELWSTEPQLHGSVRVCNPIFFQLRDWQAMMAFSIYLALGPMRPIRHG
jgi:hypothetical protein